MWSLGVILYKILFSGRYPFLDSHKNYDVPNAFKDILRNKLIIPPNKRNPKLVSLCKKMLEKKQDKRISWEELFRHELIAPHIQIQQQLEDSFLNNNNAQQLPIKGLKSSSYFSQQIEILRASKIKIQPFISTNLAKKKKKK